jgi:hypothetical protein
LRGRQTEGFTFNLQRLARCESGSDASDFRLALFTGSHGASVPLGEFERVLMVASVFGPIAIPTRTDEAPAQEILNQALKEDALNDSYVRKLQISSRD